MQPSSPGSESEDIYSFSKFSKIKLLVMAFALIFFGFLINFPFSEFIEKKVAAAIAANRNCPISYSKIKMEWFFPKIILEKPMVGGRCFGSGAPTVKLDSLNVVFWGPSFLPPGVRFLIEAKKGTNELESYVSVSFNKVVIKIPDTQLTGPFVKSLLDGKRYFNGKINLQGLFELKTTGLSEADLLITSKNLTVTSQNVGGLSLPDLPLNLLNVKVTLDNGKDLKVESLKVGKTGAPLVASVDGKVTLNQKRIQSSTLDLKGEIQFSQSFLDKFGIINLLLASKKPVNGFYKFTLKGPAYAPKPNFL